MSRMALNIAHFKKGAVGSLGGHNWYKRGSKDEHSNQDIDPERSKNNIPLVLPEDGTFYRNVKSLVDASTGRVTAASVWVSEWILYPPESLQDPKTADPMQLHRYYQDALEWMEQQGFHTQLAVIHMDETTVHAHIDTVPITEDGRLSRKDVYTRTALNQIHTDLAKHLAAKGWDIQRGESTKGKQVRAVSVPEYKKQAEEKKLALIGELGTMEVKKEELQEQLDQAEERLDQVDQQLQRANAWLQQIPGWPEYEAEAEAAWNTLERFRKLMQETFNSGWIFRNKKAEQGLLTAVEGVRDAIMAAVSALRGFEANWRVPEPQQRSKVITKSLDNMIQEAATKVNPQKLKAPSKVIDEAER